MTIERNINKRWENGIEHHPRSEEIYEALAYLDYNLGSDYFCFKSGGDGDNGEHLMYLLDIFFESEYNDVNYKTGEENEKAQTSDSHAN